MSDAAIRDEGAFSSEQSIRHPALFYGACVVLGLVVVLGGGTRQGLASDLFVQFASLPLLGLSIIRLVDLDPASLPKGPLILLAALIMLFLAQLVPLPPALWSIMPTRQFVVETFSELHLALPWRPLTLSASGTLFSLFSMVPAAALFLATIQLNAHERILLLAVPICLGVVSVFLGLAQLFGSDPRALTLYVPANVGDAVGFFANRNHFAALLYSLVPLAIGWIIAQSDLRGNRRTRLFTFGACAIGALFVGLSVAFSRAGVTLGVAALFGSMVLALRTLKALPFGRITVAAVAAVMLLFALLLQFGLIDLIMQRSATDLYRSTMAHVTVTAISAFYAFGSGFGTFIPVYKMFEQVGDVQSFYANHAHNDWLEIALEGGIGAIILLLAFLVWFLACAARLWTTSGLPFAAKNLVLARAATISIALLLLHSLVDYPLRTTTLMGVFAVCGGLMCPRTSRRGSRAAAPRHALDAGDDTGLRLAR